MSECRSAIADMPSTCEAQADEKAWLILHRSGKPRGRLDEKAAHQINSNLLQTTSRRLGVSVNAYYVELFNNKQSNKINYMETLRQLGGKGACC